MPSAVLQLASDALGGLADEPSYLALYQAEPADRIRAVRNGLPASAAKRLVADLHIEQSQLFPALNLSVATVNRKALRREALARDESERVMGVARLVGQLQALVDASGDPEGFDAAGWLSRWLREALPSLGGARPLDLLDTMEGQALVSDALGRIQSGAYG